MMDERVGILHSVWENCCVTTKGIPSDDLMNLKTRLCLNITEKTWKKYTVHSHSIDIFSI